MKTALFQGSGVALVTPFTREGYQVDYPALGRLIDFQIAGGTDAILLCGTTGEPSTILPEEKDKIITYAVDRVRGRVPVLAGAGHNDTCRTIDQARRLEALGADGLLIVTPYYNKTTQEGLIRHYEMVADAVHTPIIMYNVPSRTGLNMEPATAERLAAHDRIAGIKEASGNIVQITELAARIEGKMALYSGNDDHVVPILSLGGAGVISVAANIIPRRMHELVSKYLAGDLEGSRAEQFATNPLNRLLFCEVNPIPVKAALEMMGLCGGALRMPLVEITEKNRALLREELLGQGLI